MSRHARLPVFALTLLLAAGSSHADLTLIQRSAGLGDPEWEEGHTELELGDANGDGHLDILSVGDHGNPLFNSEESGLMCWLNDGAGVWDSHQLGHFGYGGIGVGDLNRDGLLDAAWGIHHDYGYGGFGDQLIGAALGDGTGAYWTPWDDGLATTGETWGMFATDLADFDGDGWLDLVSQSFGGSNGIRVYRNHGDGTWSPALNLSGGSVYYTIETGDFNADGYLDFACTRSGGTVRLGDGDFGFTIHDTGLAGTPSAVEVGDIDGDGRDDLLLALSGGGVRAYRLDAGSDTWVNISSGLPTGSTEQVQLGDLNGDGLLDAVTYYRPVGRTFLGDGGASWTADAVWSMPSPGDGTALRVDGDIDHDGREDIVVLATQSGFPFYRNQLRVYSPWLAPVELSARVVSPDGGETLRLGSIRELRWVAAVPAGAGETSATLRLSTSGEGGPWTTLADGLPNSGIYEWQVSGEVSEHCRIELTVDTAGAGSVVARSVADFRIAPSGATAAPWRPTDGAQAGWLRVAPPPVTGSARVSWSRPGRQPATLRLYSASGRLVDQLALPGELDRDGSRRWSPPAELPAGVYLLRLEEGAWERSAKLVLLRGAD